MYYCLEREFFCSVVVIKGLVDFIENFEVWVGNLR